MEERKRDIVQGMVDDGKTPIEVYHAVKGAANQYLGRLREQGLVSHSIPREGEIPTIHVTGQTLAEVWENTFISLVAVGQKVHTGYDLKNKAGEYISFPSSEATVMMNIADVFGEPKFHKNYLAYLGASLGDYKAEIEGIKDHWMVTPEEVVKLLKEGRFGEVQGNEEWKYTYYQRLFSYPFLDIEAQPRTINQIDDLLDKLQREPLSKSAQAITWDPRWDHNGGRIGVKWDNYDSPCLQRLWFRLIPNEDESEYTLNLNTHWRSRDHPKAVPQNIYAVTEVYFREVQKSLEKRLGVPVKFGRYVDVSDSLHVYGHYLDHQTSAKDAMLLLKQIFDAADGQPAEERFLTPGEPMHDATVEWIEYEYNFRKTHPEKTDILPTPV